jgi:hypothetical protein
MANKELRASLPDPIITIGDYRLIKEFTATFATTATVGTVKTIDLGNGALRNNTGTVDVVLYNPNLQSKMGVEIKNVINVGAGSLTTVAASAAFATGATSSATVTGYGFGEYSYLTVTNQTALSTGALSVTGKIFAKF